MPAAVQHVEAIRGQRLNYLKALVRMPIGKGHPATSLQAALTLLS